MECSIFPSVQELLANLALPPDAPPPNQPPPPIQQPLQPQPMQPVKKFYTLDEIVLTSTVIDSIVYFLRYLEVQWYDHQWDNL